MDEKFLQHTFSFFQSCPQHKGGGHFSVCTNVCQWLRKYYFPEAKIVGYHHDDNPEAKIGEAEGGHDFLLLDDKWIIDFWYKDMYDPEFPLYLHIADAGMYYGDPAKWEDITHNF